MGTSAGNEEFTSFFWLKDVVVEALLALIFFPWLFLGFPWKKRARIWLSHVNQYVCVKNHIPRADFKPAICGSERIEFLTDYLDVIDRKIGAVLQLQALLATVAGLLLSSVIGSGQTLATFEVPWPIKVFGAIFLSNTVICLLCVTHIYWGDLDKEDENAHVKRLIHAVMMRTAGFRIAVPLTIASVIFLGWSVYTIRH